MAAIAGRLLQAWRLKNVVRPPNSTFGEMRASGVRDVLIYRHDHRCSHHVETNADGQTDDVRLSDIEDRFTCTACGRRGAEVRAAIPMLRVSLVEETQLHVLRGDPGRVIQTLLHHMPRIVEHE